MKNLLNIISRCAVSVAVAGAFCMSSQAFAQSPEATGADQKTAKKETNDKSGKMQLDSKDKNFMMEAAKGGMMEVEMGKMAQSKGQSDEVKNIGKTMVTDHTKANNQLMALASKKGVQLDKSAKMEKMNGANFDQEYLDSMVKDHEKDIAAFENAAKNGMDSDVKSFASQTLPTLKKHLSMIKSAQGKMGKSTAKKTG